MDDFSVVFSIPVVLTKNEVFKVIENIKGIYNLMALLMYGCGLRMSEVLNLRIKDIDMGFDKIYIWDSKSLKDRATSTNGTKRENICTDRSS